MSPDLRQNAVGSELLIGSGQGADTFLDPSNSTSLEIVCLDRVYRTVDHIAGVSRMIEES